MGRKTVETLEEKERPVATKKKKVSVSQLRKATEANIKHGRNIQRLRDRNRARVEIGYACDPLFCEESEAYDVRTVLENAFFKFEHFHAKGGPIHINTADCPNLLLVTSGRGSIVNASNSKKNKVGAGAVACLSANTAFTIVPDIATLFQFDLVHPR